MRLTERSGNIRGEGMQSYRRHGVADVLQNKDTILSG